MKEIKINDAINKVINDFDEWNNATGVFTKGESYYYEVRGIIENAVKAGCEVNDR